MKLNQLAIAAFAASMAVAYAGGDKHNDKKMSVSGDVTAENAAAPAGYADKSVAGTKKSKQKDTTAGQAQPDAGLGGTPTAQNSGAPAGYSDQSAAASAAAPKAGDTQAAQVQSGTGAAADTSISSSTTLSGSTTSAPGSAAPAGYSDKASSLDSNVQGDTKGAK